MSVFSATSLTLGLATSVLPMGCGSQPKYVEPGGSEAIMTVGDVDPREIERVSLVMLRSMMKEGAFSRGESNPPIVMLEAVVNDTASEFDGQAITAAIFEELTNSGTAKVMMIEGPNISERARREAVNRFKETGQEPPDPDFALKMRVTSVRRSAGSTKLYTFYFRMELVHQSGPNLGIAAWSKQESIGKQGEKGTIGF